MNLQEISKKIPSFLTKVYKYTQNLQIKAAFWRMLRANSNLRQNVCSRESIKTRWFTIICLNDFEIFIHFVGIHLWSMRIVFHLPFFTYAKFKPFMFFFVIRLDRRLESNNLFEDRI